MPFGLKNAAQTLQHFVDQVETTSQYYRVVVIGHEVTLLCHRELKLRNFNQTVEVFLFRRIAQKMQILVFEITEQTNLVSIN